MATKKMNPLVRAITDAMWERDRRQMRAIDALLSLAKPQRKRLARRERRRRGSRVR